MVFIEKIKKIKIKKVYAYSNILLFFLVPSILASLKWSNCNAYACMNNGKNSKPEICLS